MATQAQLEILRAGVKVWNRWRKENPQIEINLKLADLQDVDLAFVHFTGADLTRANLSGANLRKANLTGTKLTKAKLRGSWMVSANLTEASMPRADLSKANLAGANLANADLTEADFSSALLLETNLTNANLTKSYLTHAHFKASVLFHTDLSGAKLHGTIFSRIYFYKVHFNQAETFLAHFDNVDLSAAVGLETVKHLGPSTLGIDTIYHSKANIPDAFLRGCGVPEDFIKYARSLVANPIEYYSCFISYSSKDQELAERLYNDLQANGVRCWFAPKDLRIGDKLRTSFDEAILVYDKLMVLLSSNSVKSQWVEKEIETAFEKERLQNRTVLFPICLDDAVMETKQAWAADIRRTRYIGSFRDWKSHDSYKQAFYRLLRDLKAENIAHSASQSN